MNRDVDESDVDPQAYQDTLPVIRADVPGVTAWTMEPFNGYAVHLPHKLMEQIEARALAREDVPFLLAHVARLTEALVDIAELSKGEPRMGGGSTFPANEHRMGRIHNRVRQAFGEEPLRILETEAKS